MKTIAFLFCALIILTTGMNVQGNRDGTHYINDVRVEVTTQNRVKTLVFHTDDPFEVTLGDGQIRYFMNGLTSHDDIFVIYGYIHDPEAPTYYDAFIVWVTYEGEVTEARIDFGALEEVKEIILIDNQMIFMIEKNHADSIQYEPISTHYVVFDEDHTDYQDISVDRAILRQNVFGDKVFLSDTYHGSYFLAFDASLQVYKDDIVYGIVNHGVYEGVVRLAFLHTAWINHSAYEREALIDYPGHYQIAYGNKTYHFTVHPIVSGVTDQMIVSDAVMIHVSSGMIYLNHDVFISGGHVSRPGYHVLSIEGVGGYEQHYQFTITSNLEGVYDGQIYSNERTVTFNGIGYLNNTFIESGHTIHEPGVYTLTIHGENGYQEVHYFEIVASSTSQTTVVDTLMFIEIGLIATAVILGLVWIVKSRVRS